MRNLILLLVIGLAAYGGYTVWNNQHSTPAPAKVAEAQTEQPPPVEKPATTPTPAPQFPKPEQVHPKAGENAPVPPAPVKRLAPEGVFYVIQAFSITTDDGIRGIRAGTPVKLIKDDGPILRVTDGHQEFDAKREYLTNDLGIAGQASAQQASQQAANAEWQRNQQALSSANERQKGADTAASLDSAQKNTALNSLLARQGALNLEAAKIKAAITEYERAPKRAGTHYYNNGVRYNIVGDTHVNDLISLRQKLATINAELSSIAVRISQVQR